MPTQICDACKEHFKQIYLFKKHCQTNETILNTVLETHVEEVEHVSDVESLEKVVENVETVTEIPKEIRKEYVKPLERDTEKKSLSKLIFARIVTNNLVKEDFICSIYV